jgi:hypothetical protein
MRATLRTPGRSTARGHNDPSPPVGTRRGRGTRRAYWRDSAARAPAATAFRLGGDVVWRRRRRRHAEGRLFGSPITAAIELASKFFELLTVIVKSVASYWAAG